MSVHAVAAESTELFVGDESAPLQIVRVTGTTGGPARIHVESPHLHTPQPVETAVPGQIGVEVAVHTHGAAPRTVLPARAVVAGGAGRVQADPGLVGAGPGCALAIGSHF